MTETDSTPRVLFLEAPSMPCRQSPRQNRHGSVPCHNYSAKHSDPRLTLVSVCNLD